MTLAKAVAALVLIASAANISAADGDPPAVVGRLSFIAGQVSFAPAQADEDWVAASLNRPVTTGDRLWTDAGGRAEMHVGSLAVRMDSRTSLDVLNLDERGLQLRLAQGSATLRLRRAADDEPVEIATPGGAVVVARPGAYRVNVDPQGTATSVTVRGGGQAEVFAPNGSFVVRDGEQATIAGSREDVAIAPPPDEFDRWAAVRDRREDRVAATRYVPPAMTGYEDLDRYGTWRTVPQYGTVWQPTAVPAGWAPYRYGHWVWIAPWGWTWVDDEPWGFAPSHYGRWIWLGRSWAWAPGHIVARPVYAPALVAFVGGPNFSVSIGAGSAHAVGWVPLGWQEPYRPWYRASHAHVRELNITNMTNITNTTNVRYVNRSVPSGVTVVSRENFAGARPVHRAALRVSDRTVAAAPVTAGSPVATPSTASLAQARPGARPPAGIRGREAVAVSAPPQSTARAALADKADNRSRAAPTSEIERPRVRVIERRERVNSAQTEPQRAAEKQAQTAPPAAAANVRERAAEKAEARQRQADARRTPAPPADVATRPTFDRSGRLQTAPQPENRGARPQDAQRDANQEQRAERQAQQRAEQQSRQGARAQAERQQERQVQQRAQVEARQHEQAQRAEQQGRLRAQQQAEQRAQPQAEQRAQAEARQQQQAQRAEQQARQRAQEQVARQQERQAQQRAQAEARQHDQAQRAERQAQQRVEQQARQRAQEQPARQQERQAQQRAQAEARQHNQAQRAEQQAQQHGQQQAREQARQQRRESSEKGGRERPRAEKSEKG